MLMDRRIGPSSQGGDNEMQKKERQSTGKNSKRHKARRGNN